MKEKWAATCKEGAGKLYLNGILDSNVAPGRPQEGGGSTFEANLEDFYAICDQIEANLKCAIEVSRFIECFNQGRNGTGYISKCGRNYSLII